MGDLIETLESFLAEGGEPASSTWHKGTNGTVSYGPIEIFAYGAQPPDDGNEWAESTDFMGNSCWIRERRD